MRGCMATSGDSLLDCRVSEWQRPSHGMKRGTTVNAVTHLWELHSNNLSLSPPSLNSNHYSWIKFLPLHAINIRHWGPKHLQEFSTSQFPRPLSSLLWFPMKCHKTLQRSVTWKLLLQGVVMGGGPKTNRKQTNHTPWCFYSEPSHELNV